MYYDRVRLKEDAKQTLRGVEPHPAYITFVYVLIINIISWLSNRVTGFNYRDFWYLADQSHIMSSASYYRMISDILPDPSAYILGLLLNIATIFILIGYYKYVMKLSRFEKGSVNDLFSSFHLFPKVIGLWFFMGLFVFLWSLLLIIPGIIASYRYSQAYYLLLEHPDWGVFQCINESKRIMVGHKAQLFVLQLSFFGWLILISLTFGILGIWKYPYIELSYVRFYEYVRDLHSDGAPPSFKSSGSDEYDPWHNDNNE